jgi:hypothetical protein
MLLNVEALNDLKVNGKIMIRPKVKIHFMIVMELYFSINGLISTRYRAHDTELTKIMKSPSMVPEPKSPFPDDRITRRAPVAPRIMPKILIDVIFSLRNKCEKIRITKGITVMMIEALIGVERFKPSKKRIWLKATPKTAQMANLKKSLFSTFSEGIIKCKIQKINTVTLTLRNIMALGIK